MSVLNFSVNNIRGNLNFLLCTLTLALTLGLSLPLHLRMSVVGKPRRWEIALEGQASCRETNQTAVGDLLVKEQKRILNSQWFLRTNFYFGKFLFKE